MSYAWKNEFLKWNKHEKGQTLLGRYIFCSNGQAKKNLKDDNHK